MYGGLPSISLRKCSMHFSPILWLCCLLLSASLHAQEYRYEIGGAAGTSFYMGDANRSKLFQNPGLAGGVLLRYNHSLHWAVKASILAGRVSGNTADSNNSFPFGASHSFSRTFAETGVQLEFNVLPYSDQYAYLQAKHYTPYLLVGVGLTAASGEQRFLNASLPLGVGFKYKIKNRMNIGIEFSMRKLLGDDFDVTQNNSSPNLEHPYGIRSSLLKNQDWYSITMIYLTWDFGLLQDPCCGN